MLLCAAEVVLLHGATLPTPKEQGPVQPARITIDYPLEGSVFPPEITAPTFLWHDSAAGVERWVVEVEFSDRSQRLRIDAAGNLFKMGALDPRTGPGMELTPELASTHTWQPDGSTWDKIKRLSVKAPAKVVFKGFAKEDPVHPLSIGTVSLSTSTDPVGAPVFYRDVPLMHPPPGEHGPISPIPQSALPLIEWKIRNLAEPESHVVMQDLPTCANCHSFSRDGKTLGLDVDGPRNDKGLYALASVAPQMAIRNKDVIRWSSFQLNAESTDAEPVVKRFGFMSQVSPEGRFVVTSIGPPDNTNRNQDKTPGFASGLLDRLYSTNYKDFRFLQVFYPTRGVLAWYDRKQGKMQVLPGADDPEYVQASAFWSPDSKYLIFSRAKARDPFPPGAEKPEYANDPRETQIQYDLYKIPFNEGKGGTAVPVLGASANGMSNNFPKVSPDGKWIVFVQNRNGLLMRPDSRLFIVPFEGGTARLMKCNTPLMNSWHTFSPNGRWLAFSSKGRSPYTQLMLTHIDAEGNDTPAILVENTTAGNRAVNLPEFVNVAQGGLESIDPQATESYKLIDRAFALMKSDHIPEAIELMRKALELDPDDSMAHFNLGVLLGRNKQLVEAQEEFRRATVLSPANALFIENYGASLATNGDLNQALVELQKAVTLQPASDHFQFTLGYVHEMNGDYTYAEPALRQAVQLSGGKNAQYLEELAKVYDATGRAAEALQAAHQALDLATQQHDETKEKDLRQLLDHLEHSGAPVGSQ
jgi:Flp pilus assembly protein TadD